MSIDSSRPRPILFPATLIWLLAVLVLVVVNRHAIVALDMPDTDDAQRLVQVRDWLGGQAWGDVDQHRMGQPFGAEMHWSRLVDLPIAAIVLVLEPVVGTPWAERVAATAAPLLAFLAAILAGGLAARRLAGFQAAILTMAFIAGSVQLIAFFRPLRIDHHNWQIALLLITVALLVDPARRFRSGMLAGLSTVTALAIGLEMLPHMAIMGGILVLAWCMLPRLGRILGGYGAGTVASTLFLYPAFVPPARWWLAACDVLSPVYLLPLIFAGTLAFILPRLDILDTVNRRLTVSLIGFGCVVAATVATFPECAGGPMATLDPTFLPVLSRISEARSLVSYLGSSPETAILFGLYPFIGIACAFLMARQVRPEERFGWSLLIGVMVAGTGLMFLQLRASSAPNAIAAIAAGAVAARLLPRAREMSAVLPRIAATVLVLMGLSGGLPLLAAASVMALTPKDKDAGKNKVSCTAAETLEPLNAIPQGVIVNIFDMGPALLVHTPHNVVSGPYHRNPRLIADSIRFWRADDREARAITMRYGADYVLGCVDANDLVSASKEAPQGQWARMAAGRTPAWLEAVPMPEGSPLRLYRVRD